MKAFDRVRDFFGYQDLTRNVKPIKAMLLFAIPLIITAFTTNGMNLLNSLVLKFTVGGDSVTAINQTAPLSSLILMFGFGCTSGFGAIIANYHGSKDEEKVKKAIVSSLFMCVIIWIVLGSIGILTLKPLLNVLKVNELYYDKAYAYFIVVLLCYIFSLISNLSGHILRALGNSFVVLVSSIIMIATQIGSCFLLTYNGLGALDTIGAALALTIAHIVNIAICFPFIFRKYKLNRGSFKFDKSIYKDLIKMGLPLGFQWSVLYIGAFILASQVNSFGVYASKGMAVYSSWEGIAINSIMGAIGTMMVNFIGQNYGAKKYKRVKIGIRDGFIIVGVIYALILVTMLPTVHLIPYIYLPKDEVNERVIFYSSTYLYITIGGSIFQGIINVTRGALQGIKRPLFPFLSGIGELLARVGVSLLIPLIIDPNYKSTLSDSSYIGLSFSNASAWFVSALIMGVTLLIMIYKTNIFKDKNN